MLQEHLVSVAGHSTELDSSPQDASTGGVQGMLFHWGWLLFFAGVPFLEWSAPGLLLVLLHWGVSGLTRTGKSLTRLSPPWTYPVAVVGMLATYALGMIPAVNKLHAFGEGLGFGLLLLFGLTRGFHQEAQSPGWWSKYLWPVPITGTVAALVGLYQNAYLTKTPMFAGRMTGVHTNPNVYSTALLLGLFLGIAALVRYRDWRSWLSVPYSALLVTALLTTGSRGAWVGVLAGMAVFALLLLSRLWRFGRRRAFAFGMVGVLAVVLVLALVYNGVGPGTRARMESVVDVEANQDRIVLWSATIRLIKSNPWLGVGMGNMKHRFAEYRDSPRGEVFGTAHNFLLQFLSESGVIGTFFMLLLIGTWFAVGWPPARATPSLLILYSLLAAMFARDLFDNSLTNFYVFFIANWVGATLVAARKVEPD